MQKILIVDDSVLMKKMLSKIIGELGYDIVGLGGDGHEGLALFKEHSPDLVILDITMPNKSGKECLEEIIALKSDAKVIMFTSVANDESIDECLELGASGYIKKDTNLMAPEKFNEIKNVIEKALAS